MNTLAGKIAIVTGGTRGIGRAVAERLLDAGAHVAVCGRTEESVEGVLQELRKRGKAAGRAADITDASEVERFFAFVDAELGPLDILVNNAGAGRFRKVAEMSVDDWRANIDLNLNGAFYCARQAVQRFERRGGGALINIASLAAKNAFSGGAGYNAAKAGMVMMGEALMLDHRHDNVRVCSILPGSVNTEFAGTGARQGKSTDWMIQPEDVADAVLFALQIPARTMVSQIEMRPSRPQK
jgi:NAD(P)-dependent dehydrogenase (short-subunit alcohol dehydrogenase family)